ncbi:LexA family protein [Pseudomonas nicosulfuronedens]
MKKRTLTPIEEAECKALKQIFQKKKRDLGLTQSSVAEAFGMTQTAISMYLNGANALNVRIASLFARLLQVPVSAFSPRLADAIHTINDAYQQARNDADSSSTEAGGRTPKKVRTYPVRPWNAAGSQFEAEQSSAGTSCSEWLASTENAGPWGYWLTVSGSSMVSLTQPSFPDGTLILVAPGHFDLLSGKFYIAQHRDGEATFKQYVHDAGVSYLAPLNPSFRTIEMTSEWTIVGRVIDAKIRGL